MTLNEYISVTTTRNSLWCCIRRDYIQFPVICWKWYAMSRLGRWIQKTVCLDQWFFLIKLVSRFNSTVIIYHDIHLEALLHQYLWIIIHHTLQYTMPTPGPTIAKKIWQYKFWLVETSCIFIILGRGYFAGLRVTKPNKATVLLTLTQFQTPNSTLTLQVCF